MKLEFTDKEPAVKLPKKALDSINTASETELRVLLYACCVSENGEAFDENDIQKLSGLDTPEIVSCLQFWRGANVLKKSGQTASPAPSADKKTEEKKNTLVKNDIPQYSGEEIAALFEKKNELRMLIDECQHIAGKMFNPHEINKIISLYDYLGLSCEYILNVYNYCKGKNKTTVHYVEKTAFNLYDEGVDTDEKLREYLVIRERLDSAAGMVRRIFGLGGRSLTKKEEGFIRNWTEVWNMGSDMIEYAYELTVNSIGKASLPYANKILESWHASNVDTVEKARESGFEYKNKSKEQPSPETQTSFDSDEFFDAALRRSYENIGKE